MAYNLTGIMSGNESNLLTFTQGVNDTLMFGWLGATFMIGFAVVLFTSYVFSTRDVGSAWLGTSFICFVMSLALVALQLLSPVALYICFIATALGVFFVWGKT